MRVHCEIESLYPSLNPCLHGVLGEGVIKKGPYIRQFLERW